MVFIFTFFTLLVLVFKALSDDGRPISSLFSLNLFSACSESLHEQEDRVLIRSILTAPTDLKTRETRNFWYSNKVYSSNDTIEVGQNTKIASFILQFKRDVYLGGLIKTLNFIPLWERTWCHGVFCVRQDWNTRTVVRSQAYTRATKKGAVEKLTRL